MDESIDVVPSADNGNVPAEAPSEQPIVETPAVVETAQPAEPVVELFELPDGRKVDAETLSKEWKENFYPDYTRKSQALAEKDKKPETLLQNNQPANPYADPEYVPKDFEEILKAAEERALKAFEAKEQARVDQRQAVENAVATQLDTIKQTDPSLNEGALFAHANKYHFTDLGLAYQNMKDMSELTKKVQTTTAANIAKRTDPVSVTPGATGARPDPSNFSSARDYLRSLK